MFAALMAIADYRQQQKLCHKINKQKTNGRNTVKIDDDSNLNRRIHMISRTFLTAYSRWLASTFTSILFIIILIVYWIISLNGALRIEAKLTPEKLFLGDSLLREVNLV
jgi:hypothetical protein